MPSPSSTIPKDEHAKECRGVTVLSPTAPTLSFLRQLPQNRNLGETFPHVRRLRDDLLLLQTLPEDQLAGPQTHLPSEPQYHRSFRYRRLELLFVSCFCCLFLVSVVKITITSHLLTDKNLYDTHWFVFSRPFAAMTATCSRNRLCTLSVRIEPE